MIYPCLIQIRSFVVDFEHFHQSNPVNNFTQANASLIRVLSRKHGSLLNMIKISRKYMRKMEKKQNVYNEQYYKQWLIIQT